MKSQNRKVLLIPSGRLSLKLIYELFVKLNMQIYAKILFKVHYTTKKYFKIIDNHEDINIIICDFPFANGGNYGIFPKSKSEHQCATDRKSVV